MKAELETVLKALTIEEKTEVYTFLSPFVTPLSRDEDISPDVLVELEKRLAIHRADLSGAITLEQFKQRQFKVK